MPFDTRTIGLEAAVRLAGVPVVPRAVLDAHKQAQMALFREDGRGWIKQRQYVGSPAAPVSACLVGAYTFAATGDANEIQTPNPEWLTGALHRIFPWMSANSSFGAIALWNDSHATFDDIRAVVGALADIERAESLEVCDAG